MLIHKKELIRFLKKIEHTNIRSTYHKIKKNTIFALQDVNMIPRKRTLEKRIKAKIAIIKNGGLITFIYE